MIRWNDSLNCSLREDAYGLGSQDVSRQQSWLLACKFLFPPTSDVKFLYQSFSQKHLLQQENTTASPKTGLPCFFSKKDVSSIKKNTLQGEHKESLSAI